MKSLRQLFANPTVSTKPGEGRIMKHFIIYSGGYCGQSWWLLGLLGAYYTVDQTEQVIITQFGKPIGDPIHRAWIAFQDTLLCKA